MDSEIGWGKPRDSEIRGNIGGAAAATPVGPDLGDQNPFARHSEAICNGKLPGFSLPAAPNHTRLVGIWRLHHSIKEGWEMWIL